MNRRTFLAGTGALVLATPLVAASQQTPVKLVMLLTGSPAGAAPEYVAFIRQLGELGWIEGRTVVVDRRWADALEPFTRLAADAVRAKPAVILSAGPDATRAAQQATSTIPIVMIASSDPRVMGVSSLAHPGGNLTGLTIGPPELTSEKRLQLVEEALPGLIRVAVVWDVKRAVDSGVTEATIGGRPVCCACNSSTSR